MLLPKLNVVLFISNEFVNISPLLIHIRSQINAPSDPISTPGDLLAH